MIWPVGCFSHSCPTHSQLSVIQPNYAQHFLGGTTLCEDVLRICCTRTCCTGCDEGTKCKCVKTFVEIIGIDSLEQQVQRHLLILGKWSLCSLYLATRANNRLAFCGYEPIPTVFKCQNTEEA